MAKEIERKFLVDKDAFASIKFEKSVGIIQAYIPRDNKVVVRIRINTWAGNREALLTVKGPNKGISRAEFEYEIPVDDAYEMFELCDDRMIEKTRYLVTYKGKTWEVDLFGGTNEGLLVAEIELDSEEEEFEIPDWITEEVTDDKRYYNSNLMDSPYTKW